MIKPCEAYIKVLVLPETTEASGLVNVVMPDASQVRVQLEELVMVPAVDGSIDALNERANLRRALDKAQAATIDALNDAAHWREKATEMRDRAYYLTGVVDAVQVLIDKDLDGALNQFEEKW